MTDPQARQDNPYETPELSHSFKQPSPRVWLSHIVWILALAGIHLGAVVVYCPFLITGQMPDVVLSPGEAFTVWLLSLPLGYRLNPGNMVFVLNSLALAVPIYAGVRSLRWMAKVVQRGLLPQGE